LQIICRNVGVEFLRNAQAFRAVSALDLELPALEFVTIVGPSGCGKTSLLRAIAGLIPHTGSIQKIGQPEAGPVLMVYQEQSLFPWMTALDNAAFGLKAQGVEQGERRRRAGEMLEHIGLSGRLDTYPKDLSLGMKQRVAVARAFLSKPSLLLMDEPFGALDAQTRLLLQQELLHVWEHHRVTVLFVTHDVEEALLLSDRVAVMRQGPGRIVSEVRVPFARPRTAGLAVTSEFLDLKRRLFDTIGIGTVVEEHA
jgi:NitT/TauT family transport system ATP-binding protein